MLLTIYGVFLWIKFDFHKLYVYANKWLCKLKSTLLQPSKPRLHQPAHGISHQRGFAGDVGVGEADGGGCA
jgi:hypothetical protein